MLRAGIDPSAERAGKARGDRNDVPRLKAAPNGPARQKLAPATHEKATWQLMISSCFPNLATARSGEIAAPDILAVLRKIEARGKIETAHRAKQRAGQVFRYAIATGRADRDPTGGDLRGALTPLKPQNRAAVTQPAKVGELMRALQGYSGHPCDARGAAHRAICVRAPWRASWRRMVRDRPACR